MAEVVVTLAFSCPGGDRSSTLAVRPVDLAHLGRQTMGDRALEQEVLGLFVQQLATIADRIEAGDHAERPRLGPTLRGSAAGVGAFALSECAAEIEAAPGNLELITKLSVLIAETRDFIATINR